MILRSWSWIRVPALVSLSLVGLVARGDYSPTGITEPFGLQSLAGLFAIFLSWFVAVAGWGRAATRLVVPSDEHESRAAEAWSLALGLGSLLAAVWASAAATFASRGIPAASTVFLAGGILAFAVTARGPAGLPGPGAGEPF